MASEIRVDKITSLSGVGTISPSPTGVDIAGITTVATLRATTGIVTAFQGDIVIEDKIIHSGDTNTAICIYNKSFCKTICNILNFKFTISN